MMKKICIILVFVLLSASCLPLAVHANMAAPAEPDIGSAVTFEKNGDISVLSEVLDIRVNGSKAEITATYRMKNTADRPISTPSMFLSPNIENSGVKVLVNGKETAFESKSYFLSHSTKVGTDDWQYAVLNEDDEHVFDETKTVDTVTFKMDLEPLQEYDVVVSYTYRLGGYPDYDFNVKDGDIEYYLKPAAMWKDFSSLTINLYLDKDMPVIRRSNLEFEKVGTRTYRYQSDSLPDEDLRITIDETRFQNFISSFRSPYLLMNIMMFLPFILILLAVVITVIIIVVKVCKSKKKKDSHTP